MTTDQKATEDDPTDTPAIDESTIGPKTEEVGRQTGRPAYVEAADEIDWRGWVLVSLVFISFLIIPGLVLFIPQVSGYIGALGFSQRQAYLVFPMIPAIILGVTAVWAALSSQSPKK